MKIAEYNNELALLDQQYNLWKLKFQDISDYILPQHGQFLERGDPSQSQNVNRADFILNDTASRAAGILGAGMQGGLCSPSRRWFRLKMRDDKLSDYGPVRDWLHTIEQTLYRIFADSNFYASVHTVFEAEGGFGTSVLHQEEGERTAVTFNVFNPGEYRLATGADNRVDSCWRPMWMTARQMLQMFGMEALSEGTKKLVEGGKAGHEYIQVIHVMRPREERDPNKIDSINKPYESVWYEAGATDNKFLRKSGFDSQPFTVPRWHVPGKSPYGWSPGHTVIGNVKMLQEFEKGGIKALHKEIEPPIQAPAKFKDAVSFLPGAINYIMDGTQGDKIEPLYRVQVNLANLQAKINDVQLHIERAFFNDLFLMIINSEYPGREMTATEILKRNEEKLLLLGPTIERQISELLDPTLERTFHVALKRGLLPPPPEEVLGQQWEVDYISVLAQAQRLTDAQSLQTYRTEAMAVAELDQMSLKKTDWMKYLEEFGDIVGVPPDIINSQDKTEALVQAEMEAIQQAQQMERMAGAAGIAKDIGSAKTDAGTALGDLTDSMRGVM